MTNPARFIIATDISGSLTDDLIGEDMAESISYFMEITISHPNNKIVLRYEPLH